MSIPIHFGTDGWRAIIGKEFTTENVARITFGLAAYMKERKLALQVVLGHDCRFNGPLFADTVARVLAHEGIQVKLAEGFVTTPMISYGAFKTGAGLGVIITASHNPASYNGYKVKGGYGGPLLPEEVKALETFVPDQNPVDPDAIDVEQLKADGLIASIDLESLYLERVRENFDLDAIHQADFTTAYDAMFGSGQDILPQIMPDATLLRCEHNPGFQGISPEPILRNLAYTQKYLQEHPEIDSCLVNDGDADRIGLMGPSGLYIDSHHIMLLLIHYLYHYKGWTGKVVTGFSSTVKIGKLCELYELDLEIVPIGFKHVCDRMLKEDILMGGEESGGIAVKGFIPERDGIWNGLVIWEAMAKTGKSLPELIDEIYALVGSFAFERIDLTLPADQKERIVAKCASRDFSSFGNYAVERLETLDGFKYYLNENEWVMIRPSGTEPVLRTYAESSTKEAALAILKATHETILQA